MLLGYSTAFSPAYARASVAVEQVTPGRLPQRREDVSRVRDVPQPVPEIARVPADVAGKPLLPAEAATIKARIAAELAEQAMMAEIRELMKKAQEESDVVFVMAMLAAQDD